MYFERVSYFQYQKDNDNIDCYEEFKNIKLPQRATKYSAGYDFYSPFYFELEVGESITIPTGIRVKLDDDKFLAIVPRSGLGFKYRLQLDNTIGIIDSDYFGNENNEGHVKVKITNDGKENKKLVINIGDAVCQGIILKYYTTKDDTVKNKRIGGIGSTSKK